MEGTFTPHLPPWRTPSSPSPSKVFSFLYPLPLFPSGRVAMGSSSPFLFPLMKKLFPSSLLRTERRPPFFSLPLGRWHRTPGFLFPFLGIVGIKLPYFPFSPFISPLSDSRFPPLLRTNEEEMIGSTPPLLP